MMTNFSSFDSVLTKLCDLTANAPDMVRCQAVQSLGIIGNDGAVPALVEALRDEDEDVRCDAATALGTCGDERGVAALLQSLKEDPCGDVKLQAVVSLGNLKATEVLPSLRLLAVSRDEGFAWDEDEILQGGWDDWLDIQMTAIALLGDFGDVEAVPFLAKALADETGQDVRSVATKALAKMGEPGVGALADLGSHPDRRLRHSVVIAAGLCTAPQAVKLLHIALADDDDQIRCRAGEILVEKNPDDPILLTLTKAKDPALRALAFGHASLDEPALASALIDEPHALVQIAIIESLGTGPQITKESDPVFRLLSTKLHNAAAEITAAAMSALAGRAGSLILPRIMDFVVDTKTDEAILWAAIKALGRIDDSRCTDELRRLIPRENRMVRLEALTALGGKARAGDARALQILTDAAHGKLSVALDEEGGGDLFDTLLEDGPTEGGGVGAKKTLDDNVAVTRHLEAVGMKVDAGVDGEAATSTLGSILGDEEKAREITEIGMTDTSPVKLSKKDLELLALARRLPKKRKVSPDGGDVPVAADIRHFSARLLGDFPRDDIASALEVCLESDDRELQRVALDSLTRITANGTGLTDTLMTRLIAMLERADMETRGLVIKLMDAGYRPEFQDVVAARLKDRDGPVRTVALRTALRHDLLPEDEASAFLRDNNATNRSICAQALAHGRGQKTLDLILDFGFLETGQHKAEAGSLLRQVDPDGASVRLLDCLGEENRIAWLSAITMLEKIHAPVGVPVAEALV